MSSKLKSRSEEVHEGIQYALMCITIADADSCEILMNYFLRIVKLVLVTI